MVDDVDRRILAAVHERGKLSPSQAAALLGVSRMTGYRRLDALVKVKLLQRTAKRGRDVAYVLAAVHRRWPRAGLDETVAWQAVEPKLVNRWSLAKDDLDAVHYVFTEMVNNAIDHSGGTVVSAVLDGDRGRLRVVITDDGIGAFERVRSERGLVSIEDAALQIEKGKQTTMPERHSGEGLFFSSKVSEEFRLEANGRAWIVDNKQDDTLLERTAWRSGTRVTSWFTPGSVPPLEHVFAVYTDDDAAFTKTKTTVKLASVGDTFLSRSQARRVAAGLDKFRHVTLDFHGVTRVGQGFVDELFRVFAAAHAEVVLEPIRMSDDVAFMVARGRSTSVARPAAVDVASDALDPAFLAMEPARVLHARELATAAADTRSSLAALVLAGRALFVLLHIEALDDAGRTRLAAVLGAVDLVARGVAAANEPGVDVQPMAPAVVRLARAAVAHVASTPKLWRWFVDDDDIERFFALPAAKRSALWGPPLS